jgi:hypothetical protein
LTMWFRRRRKAGSDDALTESLRSLQTLLDDRPTKQREEDSLPPVPSEKPEPHVADPSPGSTAHSVVSEEHLTWDFDVDLSTEELDGSPPDSAGDESPEPLNDDGETLVVEISDNGPGESEPVVGSDIKYSNGEFSNGKVAIQGKPDATAIDTIPVLNNVVFMPTTASTPRSGAHTAPAHTHAHAAAQPLVELCIDDFRKRLTQHDLPALDLSGEQRLRTFLTLLLKKMEKLGSE